MRRWELAAGLMSLAVAAVAPAQPAPKRLELLKPTASHPEEFTGITSLRELSDGRALVTDGREQRIVVLDFATGSAAVIGRRGGGPNEYGMVTALLPLGGDSSLMVDLMQRRWLVFDGDRIAATIPQDAPGVKATASQWVRAADARGRVLVKHQPDPPNGVSMITETDSVEVLLVERATGKEERVARIRPLPTRREIQRDGDRITFSSSLPMGPLSIAEDAVLFADGTVAIARLDPFRVDWRSADGRWRLGAPLPVARIRMDARERDAFFERNPNAGSRPAGVPPNVPWPSRPTASDFPEFIPPFPGQNGVVIPGPRGLLFIRRSKSADFPGLSYFVVDRAGRLIGELPLASNESIVGAGEGNLYIGWKDEDDIQRVRRHPWR